MTREEAIARIGEAMPTLWKGTRDAIQTLIPELAESEDERVRKGLVKLLTDASETFLIETTGIKKASYLAYLEKQKESLHITEMCKENAGSFTDEDEDRTINGCLLAANAERRCKRVSEELLEELGLADYTKFFYEQGVEKGKKEREKQKEQNPAEWSEKDNIGWDEALACVTRAEKAAKNEEELQNAVTAENWLKEIKFKYYVHPVKQEWSKEEKRQLNRIYAILGQAADTHAYSTSCRLIGDKEAVELQDFLRSIAKPQIPEWSEKDEKMKESIIKALYGGEHFAYESEINWLKSLRPSWKPSEH